METCYCEKCQRTMNSDNFYTQKDGTKTELCKKCLTMHIDNFDPDTFLWLLEKLDVPYAPQIWNELRDKAFQKNPTKMNGMSVFGKYLSTMKLKQYKTQSWATSDQLQKDFFGSPQQQAPATEEMIERAKELKQQLDEGQISEAQQKTLVSTEIQKEDIKNAQPDVLVTGGGYNPYVEENFMKEEDLPDPAAELTEDDKIYLAMKWGRTYTANEWIIMEQHYNKMLNSFDIQDADSLGTLILTSKTYLKMNQAIDMGDFEGFQKLSRVQDSLRKSAKFTAAQHKEQQSDFVDSVGELITLCEKEGFIPRYATDIPQDKVDMTLKDMTKYLHDLVTEDLGFGQQIETALQKIKIQQEIEANEDDDVELDDTDIIEQFEDVNEQKEEDQAIMEGVVG